MPVVAISFGTLDLFLDLDLAMAKRSLIVNEMVDDFDE